MESDYGSVLGCVREPLYLALRNAAVCVFLLIIALAVINLSRKSVRKSIYYRKTYSVQASRYLVSAAAEFSAGMKHRKYDLKRGYAHFMMNSYRDTSSVVLNSHGAVFKKLNNYCIADACKSFVNTVVYDLINKVVQASLACASDIHTRTFAHGLQAVKHLYGVLVVSF